MTKTLRVLAIASLGLGLVPAPAPAHDIITTKITWSKEISRIVFKRCAFCHRGTAAGKAGTAFSLLTYQGARPWAVAIKEEVLNRRMPPWNAVKGFGDFRDDRGLTQAELELISTWVEGGAPEGDPRYNPTPPDPARWQDPAIPKGSTSALASDGTAIPTAASLLAIRPRNLKAGASIQVTAARPDGTIEPLLWIYQFNPRFERTYYFRAPVRLPAGTKIVIAPPGSASATLFTGAAAKTSTSTKR